MPSLLTNLRTCGHGAVFSCIVLAIASPAWTHGNKDQGTCNCPGRRLDDPSPEPLCLLWEERKMACCMGGLQGDADP